MDNQYPFVNLHVSGRNLGPSSETRTSSVMMRVETIMDDYFRAPNGRRMLTRSYQTCAPRLLNFNLHSDITSFQIYEILDTQLHLSPHLSRFLTANITRMATRMELGRNVFTVNLLVTVTYATVFNFQFPSFMGGEAAEEEEEAEEEDVVEKLVVEGVIEEDSQLESESCCPICLDNLMGVPGKAPTRMPCSHIFHDGCISQWLYQKDSCPLCRRVLYKT